MIRVAALLLVGLLLLPGAALAQGGSGSTGGTVGKRDRAVSGDHAPAPARPAEPAKPAPAQPQAAARAACPAIAGTWTAKGVWNILFGDGDTVIGADGTATHRSGNTARWSCAGGIYVFEWTHGYTDRVSLSPDGRSLTGTNQQGSAVAFVRN
jgi:hypothetical protein